MPSVELCAEALRLRLVTEDGKCYLQVAEVDEEIDHWAEADPYNLLSVLNGLRYHVSAGNSLCSLYRVADEVVVDYQNGDHPPIQCRVDARAFEETICSLAVRARGYAA